MQSDAKQPAGRNASAKGLIAAFRPVEQLPASSAAAALSASSAGSNASDRQAADDLLDLRSYVDALLLRAKVLRLEESAHRPEDVHERQSAGTSVCLSPFGLLLQCYSRRPLPSVFSPCQPLYSFGQICILIGLGSFTSPCYICHLESRL